MSKLYLISTFLVCWLGFLFFALPSNASNQEPQGHRYITINDNGLVFAIQTAEKTLDRILLDHNIKLNPKDKTYPQLNEPVFDRIIIKRATPVTIQADEQEQAIFTYKSTIEEVLAEVEIKLEELDKINYQLDSQLFSNIDIIVTRITQKTETITSSMDFKTTTKNDPDLLLGKTIVEQAGKPGEKEEEFLIIFENNKEIKRTLQKTTVLKEPISEIIVKGTKVLTGRTEAGQASFVDSQFAPYLYGKNSGLTAAHKTWPKGSKIKVTNLDNNKTIVVQVVDRGPYIAGRVIDLSAEAFSQIASIGAGLANVRIEEILN